MQAALEEKPLKEKLRLQTDSSKYAGSTHSPRTWEREEGEKILSIFHGMRIKWARQDWIVATSTRQWAG